MPTQPANAPIHNPHAQVWPATLGPMVTGSHSQVRVAWNGKNPHPSMVVSSAFPQQLKELSISRAATIFTEYLTYDKDTPEQMKAFADIYPWVLTEPMVCNTIVGDPNCYNALRAMNWWDTALDNINHPGGATALWLKNSNIQALAYCASDEDLARLVDWAYWEAMAQEHGAMYTMHNDTAPFVRTEAFVILANRLGVSLAPLMCAAMHVLLPLDSLEKIVAGKWTSLQKAQYAWLLGKSGFVGDIWPTTRYIKQMLRHAHQDLSGWIQLAGPQELENLTMVYALNNANIENTVIQLIRLAQIPCSTESLDYTHALENDDAKK